MYARLVVQSDSEIGQLAPLLVCSGHNSPQIVL